jgi:hypothetical protein
MRTQRFISRRYARLTIAAVALLLGAAARPARLAAQGDPYTLQDVQLWISSGVKPARMLRLAQARCLAFRMDAGTEAELRAAGAGEVLLEGLRSVCVRPAQMAVVPAPPSPRRSGRPPVRYARDVLRPLYYGSPTVVTLYGAGMTAEWTGSDSGSWQVDFPGGGQGTVRLPTAPKQLVTYGMSVGSAGLRLELEGYLHQDDFTFLVGGPSLEPFIPIGRTRMRAIVGATGLVGVALQRLQVDDGGGQVFTDTLDLTSVLAGGDGRLGLAYHPNPGFWVFAEARYRYLTTISRQLDLGGSESTRELPWPKLSFRGPSLRIGIGF